MDSYIIQSKDNSLIKKSSSGGMFAELARNVLSRGGVVFGCAMEKVEDGVDVKHIYIEDENDLYKLQGSKYVQSNLGNTIKQAKAFLDCGRLVLFSGTPCQIAGLKAFVKQDYENLITVDLSCTGTPALEIFNGYVRFLENKYRKKIVSFEFRNKEKMGWCCGNALVTFDDGIQKILYNNVSSYLNLFISKKLQKESCQNCKFAGLERVSDITLADAWGVDIEYLNVLKTKFNQSKGVSLVLLNSAKAHDLFDKIEKNLVYRKIDIAKLQKYNGPLNFKQNISVDTTYLDEYKKFGYQGVERMFCKTLGMKYYYNIIKHNTPKFIKSIINFFKGNKKKTDCLLYTMFYYPNYGSLITAYSLQKTTDKLGVTSKLIYRERFGGYNTPFVKKYLRLTKRCINTEDLKKLNKTSDTFILGSDNLINLTDDNLHWIAQSLLNFTDDNKKRLMISGSIGAWDGSTQDRSEHNYIKYLLERFDYVSTREEHGKEVFETVFDVKSDWINDPVFYLEKEDYIELTKDVKMDYSDKIMQYILYPTDKTDEVIDFYKKNLGADVEKFDGNENVKYFSRHKNKSVENWLAAIINSKLIITDSFHCVAFCLIFNRPFVCIKNTHATVRFTSLFKRLGINIPLIESVEDLDCLNLDYDKQQVNRSLRDIREFALNKIEENMLKPKESSKNTNETMKNFNKEFIKNSTVWYKKNRLFYFGIIVPFVIPVKRLLADIKR